MKRSEEDYTTADERAEKELRKNKKRRRKVIRVSRVPQHTEKIKDTVSALSIPDEVVGKCTMMTVLEQREVTVEGHEGILAYEEDCIRIRTGKAIVSVGGKQLVIDYYNDEELKIAGCIEHISWKNR